MEQDRQRKRRTIDGFLPPGSRIPAKGPPGSGGISQPAGRPQRMLDDFRGRKDGLDSSSIQTGQIDIPTRSAGARKSNAHLLGKRLDSYEKRKRKRRKKRIIIAVIFLAFAFFGILAAKGYLNLLKVFGGGGGAAALNENVDPSQLKVEGDGRVNILLLGRGGSGHEGPDLTDTIILVSIDPIDKSAGIVSIPRDFYVNVADYGSMKINSVFYSGKQRALSRVGSDSESTMRQAEEQGLRLTENTVEKVLGVPIHYNAIIDFKGFIKAIDTVGGIDIDVPKDVSEHMRINGHNYFLNVKAGPKHFDGFEALAYSRSRYTSLRGDFDRSERQRLVIIGLKDKILSLGTFSNPAKISQLIDQFGNNVRTNFEFDDMNKLYSIVREINSSSVQSIGLADPPNNYLQTASVGGLSVILPVLGQSDYFDIHYYIRNTLRDSFLKQEDAAVVILNGTGRSGAAIEKANELRSYGYKVTRIDNAPSANYAKTMLIDMGHRDNKYTKHYLQKRLGIIAANNLPDNTIRVGTNDFVIILGDDTSL